MDNTINNSFKKSVFGKVKESDIIIATFKDGQEAEFTKASLYLLKSDRDTLKIVEKATGKVIFERV